MLDIPESVKALFFKDSVLKNIGMTISHPTEPVISQDNIGSYVEKESLQISESLSSRGDFRFGLCEDSVLKFNTSLFNADMKGYTITLYMDVDVSNSDLPISEWHRSQYIPFPFYPIPLGSFVIDKCEKNSNNELWKITAYSSFPDMYNSAYQNKYLTDMNLVTNYTINFNPFNYLIVNSKKYTPQNISAITISDEGESKTVTDSTNNYTYSFSIHYKAIGSDIANNWENEAYLFSETSSGSMDENATVISSILSFIENNVSALSPTAGSAINALLEVLNINGFVLKEWSGSELEERIENIGIILNGKARIVDNVDVYIYQGSYLVASSNFSFYPAANYTVRKITDFDGFTIPLSSIAHEEVTEQWIVTKYNFSNIADLDMRGLVEDALELRGYFGGINRYDEFVLYDLVHYLLTYPDEDLYPSNTLYPCSEEGQQTVIPSGLISVKHEEVVQYGGLRCEFKNDADSTAIYEQIWDSDLPVYDLGQNEYLMQNVRTTTEMRQLLQELVTKLKVFKYTPAKVDMVGLPFMEKGDILYLHTPKKSITTIVFDRDLKGIHSLRDKVTAK